MFSLIFKLHASRIFQCVVFYTWVISIENHPFVKEIVISFSSLHGIPFMNMSLFKRRCYECAWVYFLKYVRAFLSMCIYVYRRITWRLPTKSHPLSTHVLFTCESNCTSACGCCGRILTSPPLSLSDAHPETRAERDSGKCSSRILLRVMKPIINTVQPSHLMCLCLRWGN